MSLTFVVVLPSLNPVRAKGLVGTMHEEVRRRVLLIDNSGLGRIAHVHQRAVGATHASVANIGVPRSWNLGIKLMWEKHAEYLLILSESIRFGPSGGLDFLAEMEKRRPKVLIHAQHGWKLLGLHRSVIDLVGIFDPWFSPAYYEESEYMVRMHMAGLPSPLYNHGEFDQVVVDASSEGDGLALKDGLVELDYAAQRMKFRRKWRCDPGGSPCGNPYGDPTLDWTFTGDYDRHRAKQRAARRGQ